MNPALSSALAFTALALLVSSSQAQVITNLDFEGGTELSQNFRLLVFNSATIAQSSNGAANDYIAATASGSSGLVSMLYDTTPASAAVQNIFTGPGLIEADIDTVGGGTSFGIYILSPTLENGGNHLLALFNWDNSGTNDLVRIFKTSNATSGSASGQHFTSGSVNTGLNVADTDFGHFSLSYRADTVDPTQAILNVTVGSYSTGDVAMGTGTYFTDYEVGLRFSPFTSGNSVRVDNFMITQVPEPSLLVMFLAAVPLLQVRRRRK